MRIDELDIYANLKHIKFQNVHLNFCRNQEQAFHIFLLVSIELLPPKFHFYPT